MCKSVSREQVIRIQGFSMNKELLTFLLILALGMLMGGTLTHYIISPHPEISVDSTEVSRDTVIVTERDTIRIPEVSTVDTELESKPSPVPGQIISHSSIDTMGIMAEVDIFAKCPVDIKGESLHHFR